MEPEEAAWLSRQDCGVNARTAAVVQVTGADRLSFLDGLLTADLKTLAPGQLAPALLLDDRARLLAAMAVYHLGEGYWLDAEGHAGADLLRRLESARVSETVDLLDRSGDFARSSLLGPGAPVLLGRLGLPVPPSHGWEEGRDVVVARTDALRMPGFELFEASEAAPPLRQRILGAGAVPLEDSAVEILRLEAGVPRFGIDVDGQTLALEGPLEDAIAPDKGCYVGQEVVARLRLRGHLRRRLVTLRIDGRTPPPPSSEIRVEENRVGRLTSAAFSRTVGSVVGLGFVTAERSAPGTSVEILVEGARLTATVAAAPLVP